METAFNRTKLCTQILANDTPKKVISPLLWSSLLLSRLRQVFIAIAPIIHLSNLSFFRGINHLNLGLVGVGWSLHSLRLLINIGQLLLQCLPQDENQSTEGRLSLKARLQTQLNRTYVEIGDDMLWVVGTLMPKLNIFGGLNLFSALILMGLDIIWLCFCITTELNQIQKAKNNAGAHPVDLEYNQKLMRYTQKKAAINGIATLCTSLILITKIVLIPLLLPTLLLNPITPCAIALLALVVTITRFMAIKWLLSQKPVEKDKEVDRSQLSMVRVGFFKSQMIPIKPYGANKGIVENGWLKSKN